MSDMGVRDTSRPESDQLLQDIADYVMDFKADSEEARRTAAYCLMDTLGCGILALKYPACTKMLSLFFSLFFFLVLISYYEL